MDEEVSEMINSKGELRCDNCGKKLAMNLQGRVEAVCPRCKHFNVFENEICVAFLRNVDKKERVCLQ